MVTTGTRTEKRHVVVWVTGVRGYIQAGKGMEEVFKGVTGV